MSAEMCKRCARCGLARAARACHRKYRRKPSGCVPVRGGHRPSPPSHRSPGCPRAGHGRPSSTPCSRTRGRPPRRLLAPNRLPTTSPRPPRPARRRRDRCDPRGRALGHRAGPAAGDSAASSGDRCSGAVAARTPPQPPAAARTACDGEAELAVGVRRRRARGGRARGPKARGGAVRGIPARGRRSRRKEAKRSCERGRRCSTGTGYSRTATDWGTMSPRSYGSSSRRNVAPKSC